MQRARTFAALLKRHRDAVGLTQEELAERARLGARTISDLERGISTSPYQSTVRRLASALGLSADDLEQFRSAARPAAGPPSRGSRTPVVGGFLGAVPTARLVARADEMARISHAMGAVEGGSGQLALLVGEPGIGKTRLAQEACVRAWERGFHVAAGRCYEAQSGVAFSPFMEALGTLYEAAPSAVREKIPARWTHLARMLPDHFPHSAASPDHGEEPQRLLRAVTGFVRDVAAGTPVAVLLDDLHCADGASLDLLAHLARHTRGDQVLLVGTYRDTEVGSRHPLRTLTRELGREQLVQKIDVGRLGQTETAALMTDRLDGADVSEEFARLVHGHTDGNPFFTVEVLKTLIERGELSRSKGRWVRRNVEDLQAPESVNEAISERVSRLQPATQKALEEASVLGQVFDFWDLVAATDIDEADAEEALEEAEASGLVRAVRDHYTFDHALTHQALYARLSLARRRRLHRSTSESLERLEGRARQKRAAEISRHFVDAGSPARALPYALMAGDQAEFAPREAERHYRRALDLAESVGDGSAAAKALEKLGWMLTTTVRYDEALAALERAADVHARQDDVESAARVEARIAQTHFRRGTPNDGIVRLTSHLRSLDRPDASEGMRRSLATLYCALARLYAAHMHYAECRDATERAATLARTIQDIGPLAEAEMLRGNVLLWLDAPDEGVTNLEKAIFLAKRSGALDTLCTAYLLLHVAYRVRGQFDRSREYAERGTAIAEKTGDTDTLAMYMTNLGLQLFHVGDWQGSRDLLERAVKLARDAQRSYFSCMPYVHLGVLRMGEGAWDDASVCFSEAAARAQDANNPEMLGYAQTRQAELHVLQNQPQEAIARLQPRMNTSGLTWIYDVVLLRVLAEAMVDAGDAKGAEEVADFAVERARLMHNRVDVVEALRVRARCLSMQGQHEEATAALEHALSAARPMPYPHAEAKILRDYGMLHLRAGEHDTAQEKISAALEVFQRLGARNDAEQTTQELHELSRVHR